MKSNTTGDTQIRAGAPKGRADKVASAISMLIDEFAKTDQCIRLKS